MQVSRTPIPPVFLALYSVMMVFTYLYTVDIGRLSRRLEKSAACLPAASSGHNVDLLRLSDIASHNVTAVEET